MSRNREVLNDFVKYCNNHPEDRFWQALCNWAKVNYILIAKNSSWLFCDDQKHNLKDTFYFEGKDK